MDKRNWIICTICIGLLLSIPIVLSEKETAIEYTTWCRGAIQIINESDTFCSGDNISVIEEYTILKFRNITIARNFERIYTKENQEVDKNGEQKRVGCDVIRGA